MSHKTLISGTAYEVVGGAQMIDGTKFQMGGGKTILGGTAFTIPFAKGIPLSTITPGAILYLNESGSPVPFYIAKHDYESGLNGAGRTLVVRKNCYDIRAFSSRNNAYADSSLDSWLRNTYLKLLDADIQAAIGTTKIYYTPGNGNTTVTTLQRAVFQLSVTELGGSAFHANVEGEALPIARTLKIAYLNGRAVEQWTRTPYTDDEYYVYPLLTNGSVGSGVGASYGRFGSRPAFTLPATTAVTANPDGTYTIAA